MSIGIQLNRAAWAIAGLFFLLASCHPCYAKSMYNVPSIRLADDFMSEGRTVGADTIRVRIFPHRRNFAPHFKDRTRSKFTIRSEANCAVYEADPKKQRKTNKLITRTKELTLNARRLQVPLWLECSQPFTLVRKKGLPSFIYEGGLYIGKNGAELMAVNILPLDHYLKGVVPAEVYAGWHMETLKSQAVAARTYAMFHISYARRYSRHPQFDVDDSISFQAYTGLTRAHARTDQAVNETTGQILLHGGDIIQAYYHADSGGVTENASTAFNMKAPYCQTKKEHYNLKLVSSEWKKKFSLKELNLKFVRGKVVSSKNLVTQIILSPSSKYQSGRVKRLHLVLADNTRIDLPIRKLKRTVSLNSSLFTISTSMQNGQKHYSFSGRGSGHGVGMNQRGAKVLASDYAWTYEQILGFYYTGTRVCSIYQASVTDKVKHCAGRSES